MSEPQGEPTQPDSGSNQPGGGHVPAPPPAGGASVAASAGQALAPATASREGPGPARPRTSSVLRERSPQEIVLDHAVLSQDLSTKVHALQTAYRGGADVTVALADLQEFVSTDLESYVRSLVGEAGADTERFGLTAGLRWLPVSSARRHAREHQRLLATFARFEHMTMGATVVPADRAAAEGAPVVHYTYTTYPSANATPAEAVHQAVYLSRVWNSHVAEEDARFMGLPGLRAAAADPASVAAETRVVLGAHLQAELACQHRELAGLVALAKAHVGGAPDLVPFSRATAALSSHANQVAVQLYPAINAAIPAGREVTERRSATIFEAARTMLKVERAIGGDAGTSKHEVQALIGHVEALLEEHASDDEALMNEFIAVAPLAELSRLLGVMRPGLVRPQTRPHFAAQSASLVGKAGALLHRRFDRLLDDLDNRST